MAKRTKKHHPAIASLLARASRMHEIANAAERRPGTSSVRLARYRRRADRLVERALNFSELDAARLERAAAKRQRRAERRAQEVGHG